MDKQNEILATKRAWRNAERPDRRIGDRRVKQGTLEDRRVKADGIKLFRAVDRLQHEVKPGVELPILMFIIGLMVGLILLVFFSGEAHAYTEQEAIKTIVGESANQGLIGMTAVGEVIRHKHSLKGFYGFKAMNHRQEPKWVWSMAKKAWLASKTSNYTHGADHFENIHAFGQPYWIKNCILTFIYKDHRFYREVRT